MSPLSIIFESPTLEGLLVREMPGDDGWTVAQEVGRHGYVIYEYRIREEPSDAAVVWSEDHSGSLHFLLARLEDLNQRCEQMQAANPTPIELVDWRWNRKRAARRFRRWVRERGAGTLEIPQQMHSLVERILSEEPDIDPRAYDIDTWIKKIFEEGGITEIEDYERRKLERPILIVTELNDAVAALLGEANETYFHGLFRATVALCRAVLEDMVERVVRVQDIEPIRDDFDVYINCIPPTLWGPKARQVAHSIRLRGNDAMHVSEVSFSEDEAWRILVQTTQLIRVLINRGGLQPKRNI